MKILNNSSHPAFLMSLNAGGKPEETEHWDLKKIHVFKIGFWEWGERFECHRL